MKYRRKPVTIEATQWFKIGDHPAVVELPEHVAIRLIEISGLGWIMTLEGGHIVSPGDWIITGVAGEHYPCKDGIFQKTYEIADALESCAAQQGWRPITEAPRDGTYILLAGPSGYVGTSLRVEVCRYDAEYRPLQPWVNHSNDSFLDGGSEPTHWMPLPAPPKEG